MMGMDVLLDVLGSRLDGLATTLREGNPYVPLFVGMERFFCPRHVMMGLEELTRFL